MSGKLSDGAGSFDVVIESVGDVVDPLRELAELNRPSGATSVPAQWWHPSGGSQHSGAAAL